MKLATLDDSVRVPHALELTVKKVLLLAATGPCYRATWSPALPQTEYASATDSFDF